MHKCIAFIYIVYVQDLFEILQKQCLTYEFVYTVLILHNIFTFSFSENPSD